MAYVTPRPRGAWELRETIKTAAGPRSRTLATFRTLTPEVIDRACRRSSNGLAPDEARAAALRAGAPVAGPAPDRAAADLLAELGGGHEPRPALRRLLLDALAGGAELPDSARSAASWVAASAERRAEALRDLLLLADRLPASRAPRRPRFPRMVSRPA